MTPPDQPAVGHAAPDATGDAVLTRSEEQLRITTHRRATQRARLTRYVETETVTRTVEVRHEQVRVDYEPVASQADEPTGSADGRGWLVLYDEEIVLTTRRVPRERVRLRTHSVTEEREITEGLRSERIELADAGQTRQPPPPSTPPSWGAQPDPKADRNVDPS